jgi:hypothetical protein
MDVVFPDPFGPSRPKSTPFSTVRDNPLIAFVSPYALVSSDVSITASILHDSLDLQKDDRG